jgi:hypothetical protein
VDKGAEGFTAGKPEDKHGIRASNTAALSLSGSPAVAVGGANAADFSVTKKPSTSVSAGAGTTFQVRFDPSAAGTRSATLSIANNDTDENPFEFSIRGEGVAPPAAPSNISVSP